ncbi:MAG: hypothetical protein KKC05_00445 [Nanoarchaeota archaeon]|nr:hypothetical protein [Nanoarchaeota archaeon]
MPEIYVGLTEEAIMTYNDDEFISREVDIRMPDNPSTLRGNLVVLEYERKQSPYFWLEAVRIMKRHDCSYIASHENPLMTPAAGAVSVFFDLNGDVSYVSFCQKDDKAPRDPGFRVPRNGFPQSESDWFTNAHLYREAFEEGLIMTRKGELVLPEEETYDDLINAIAGTMVSRTGLKINGTKRVPIEFRDGYDRLRVY